MPPPRWYDPTYPALLSRRRERTSLQPVSRARLREKHCPVPPISSCAKFDHISCRTSSISSSVGPGPRSAHSPYSEREGVGVAGAAPSSSNVASNHSIRRAFSAGDSLVASSLTCSSTTSLMVCTSHHPALSVTSTRPCTRDAWLELAEATGRARWKRAYVARRLRARTDHVHSNRVPYQARPYGRRRAATGSPFAESVRARGARRMRDMPVARAKPKPEPRWDLHGRAPDHAG